MISISQNLKEARKSAALSQEKMAELLGVSRNYVAQIEMERKRSGLNLLSKISAVTGRKVDDFICADPLIQELRRDFGDRAKRLVQEIQHVERRDG
jgi:transcriptional regulator with XRE-family HTH domain